MAHRILIVDDDQEFNLLLTDVFAQADYEVRTCPDVTQALQVLQEDTVDLLVTDFRMPGPNGLELIKQVRGARPNLPIIMVSGYLENGMIRDLIQQGVGGIFMKPLNIFSLLKKTEELLEHEEAREAGEGGLPATGYGANVGFVFRAFPCRDARARDFARRLYELRDFAKNLLLIAEPGTDLRMICEDLSRAGCQGPETVFFDPEDFDEAAALAPLQEEGPMAAAGLTFVFTRAERLDAEQRGLIYAIQRRQGSFADRSRPCRFIFCLDRELDDYYDEGLVDEEFYLFLGTTELRVPPLREIPEDLPVIAEAVLAREAGGKILEGAARAFLQRHEWRGNLDELRDKLRFAARLCPGKEISVHHLQRVLSGETAEAEEEATDGERSPLESYLRDRRRDYLQAFESILGRRPGPASALSPSQPLA